MSEDWPEEPVKVKDSTFEEFINDYDLALIDCWAAWCGPCKMMEPVLDELAEDMQGEAAVGKLNVDENKEKSREYGISSIPTLLIFKDGENVDRLVGAMDKNTLKQKLKSYQ
ncbi:MAG: thioredoxin [Candidatus Saliniplasma sp.]